MTTTRAVGHGAFDAYEDRHEQWHAFLVVGERHLFFYHLPNLYAPPHMFEIVLRASIPGEAQEALRMDQAGHHEEQYFALNQPEHIPLHDLTSGKVSGFQVNIFRGIPNKDQVNDPAWDRDPWGDEKPIITGIEATVAELVHYRQVDVSMRQVESERYWLWGTSGNSAKETELFLSHSVVSIPEYDHVAAVKAPVDDYLARHLAAGVLLSFPDLGWDVRSTRCTDPFAPGSAHTVRYHGMGSVPRGDQGVRELKITVDRTVWFSTKVVNGPFCDPCYERYDAAACAHFLDAVGLPPIPSAGGNP